MIFKKSILKNEFNIISSVLVVSALIYTVFILNSQKNVAPGTLKAAACKTDECSTATGCQLPGYLLDGFKCVGSNQWEAPDGAIVPGGSDGPLPTAAPAADSNQAIAKRVLDWIETQRDANGNYLDRGPCDKGQGQSCNSQDKEDPTVAFYTIWARYNYYKKTGNQADYSIITRDIDELYNRYVVPDNINMRQSNQWMCRNLYDIGHDDAFLAQRQKLEFLCQNTWYVSPAMDDVRNKAESGQPLPEPEVENVRRGEKLPYDPIIDPDRYTHGFYWYTMTVSNLIAQNSWFNDQQLLSQAKLMYRKTLQIYSNKKTDPDFMFGGDAPVAIAALDLYKATNQQKYLDFVNTYISERQNRPFTGIDDAASYLFLLDQVYPLTQNPQYLSYLTNTISLLQNESFNLNTGSFQEISPLLKPYLDIFDVRTNSLIISVLLNHL